MSRISTPKAIDAAPGASRRLVEAVKKQSGAVSNLFRLAANSPAALEGYLGLSNVLSKGELPPATRERIAPAVAEINGFSYWVWAHTYHSKNLAKLDDAEITVDRNGASNEPKAEAAVRFAVAATKARGHVGEAELRALKAAGYNFAPAIENVMHIVLKTWTNCVNEVAQTKIDFPVIRARSAAAHASTRSKIADRLPGLHSGPGEPSGRIEL